MKRFVSKIVFCLWVGFIISCSSSAVYKPFYVELLKAAKTQYSGNIDIRDITVEKVENIEWATNKFKLAASGKVVQVGGGITTDKGNIDVCDITVEKIENIGWATNKFKLAATGKIVLIGGRGTTSEARGIEKVLARTLNDTLKNVLLSTGYGI